MRIGEPGRHGQARLQVWTPNKYSLSHDVDAARKDEIGHPRIHSRRFSDQVLLCLEAVAKLDTPEFPRIPGRTSWAHLKDFAATASIADFKVVFKRLRRERSNCRPKQYGDSDGNHGRENGRLRALVP